MPCPVVAQYLTDSGAAITVQTGATLHVGTGGLSNQFGTLTNAGTLRVDGPLDLNTGALEVRSDLTNTSILTPGTSPVTFGGTTDQLLTLPGATLYQMPVTKVTAGANLLRLTGDLTVSNLLSISNGLVNTKNGSTVNPLRLPNGTALSGETTGRYVLGALEITRNAMSGTPMDFGHGVVLNPTTTNLGTVVITRRAGLLTADVSYGSSLLRYATATASFGGRCVVE